MTKPPSMSLKYALGWWAALVILFGPTSARSDLYTTTAGIFISLTIITVVAYLLARLGWRLGWFRKQP